jgi:hypothetical protein
MLTQNENKIPDCHCYNCFFLNKLHSYKACSNTWLWIQPRQWQHSKNGFYGTVMCVKICKN